MGLAPVKSCIGVIRAVNSGLTSLLEITDNKQNVRLIRNTINVPFSESDNLWFHKMGTLLASNSFQNF